MKRKKEDIKKNKRNEQNELVRIIEAFRRSQPLKPDPNIEYNFLSLCPCHSLLLKMNIVAKVKSIISQGHLDRSQTIEKHKIVFPVQAQDTDQSGEKKHAPTLNHKN